MGGLLLAISGHSGIKKAAILHSVIPSGGSHQLYQKAPFSAFGNDQLANRNAVEMYRSAATKGK
jgi:hypothetical protein